MANHLKVWQKKLDLTKLYKVRIAPNRNVGLATLIIQGSPTDTVDIYVAIDGVTENSNPTNLAGMSKIAEDISGSYQFTAFDFNFIAAKQNTGTSDVYLNGYVLDDLGGIS